MIKIAIVEDEKTFQKQLCSYVQRYQNEYEEKTSIEVFADGDQIVEDYSATYDIIFLDIEMKHLNGMDTAKIIRKLDQDVILIFVTNMTQYAIQGYTVGALNYILKPVSYFAFSQELDKAVKKVKAKMLSYLMIPQDQGMVRLDTKQIIYLESQGHNATIHSEYGDHTFRSTLKAIEEKLDATEFVRCNSCYLINLRFVDAMRENSVVVAGKELQMSRPRKKKFKEALTNYLGGK